MKHIQQIDEAIKQRKELSYFIHRRQYDFVEAKPEEALGLLKWKIRFIKAFAVLSGKADAFTYTRHLK